MADIAYNPKTGEAVRLEGGQWVPTQVAKNDKTGEVMAFDGAQWAKVGGAPERSTGDQIKRGVGLGAQGFTDAVAAGLGAPVDLANRALSVVGLGSENPLGGSQTFRDVFDYVASVPSRLQGKPTDPRLKPENTAEKFIYGASRGAGDVATMLAGAGVVKGLAAPGGTTARVADALMQAPGTQFAASTIGSGVGEATDSPIAGIGTTLAVGMAPSLARMIMAPQFGKLSAEQKRLAQVLAAEKVPMSTGQMTGSKSLQTVESVLGNLPLSGGMKAAQDQAQREAFTAAVLKRAGIDAKTATPEVLAARKAELGRVFDQITSKTGVNIDDTMIDDLLKVADKYADKIPATKGQVDAYINSLTAPKLGGVIPGKVYQETRSMLGRQSDSMMKSDYVTARALKDVRNALDAAMERSVPPADATAFKSANRDYRNLKTIMKAMEGASAETQAGAISPARLRMAATQAAKGNYSTGSGDLNDLARAGGAFLKELPDSFTAQRAMWHQALTGGAFGGGVGTAAMLNPAALAALAIPPGAQKALQSKAVQTWLTRQRAPGADPASLLAALLAQRSLELPPPGGR